jgi:DNA-binding CsgD family transcriptional regulator
VKNAPQPVARAEAGTSALAGEVNDWLAGIAGSAERVTDGLAELSTRFDLGADTQMASIVRDVVGITRAASGALEVTRELSASARRQAPPSAVLGAQFRLTSGGVRSDLGTRELEVVRLMAGGMSNRAVADGLHISLNTVRNHVQHILYKLHVHSKLAAVAAALDDGLIEQARPVGSVGQKGANAPSPSAGWPSMPRSQSPTTEESFECHPVFPSARS